MSAVRQPVLDTSAGPAIVSASRLAQLRAARDIVAHEGQSLIDLSRRMDVEFSRALDLLAA